MGDNVSTSSTSLSTKVFFKTLFVVVAGVINGLFGAVLLTPTALVCLYLLHLWSIISGGYPVLDEGEGSLMIPIFIVFLIAILFVVFVNYALVLMSNHVYNGAGTLSKLTHVIIAIASILIGLIIASFELYDRLIFLP